MYQHRNWEGPIGITGLNGSFFSGSHGSLGQIIGNQFIFLKIMIMDLKQDSEYLLTSDCHSREHNSELFIPKEYLNCLF